MTADGQWAVEFSITGHGNIGDPSLYTYYEYIADTGYSRWVANDTKAYTAADLVFDVPSIKATVLNQYFLAKYTLISNCYNFVGSEVRTSLLINKSDINNQFTYTNAKSGSGSTTYNYDNINGVDPKTDNIIHDKVDTVDALGSTRWYFRIDGPWASSGGANGISTAKIYRLGFLLKFDASLTENSLYVRLEGREKTGDDPWFSGVTSGTVENPSEVIEDLCASFVPGMSRANLDEDSFDVAYTARSDWKLALSIYSGE
jgi:hypothetical protein